MNRLLSLFILLFLFSCSKPKKYKCKKNCITIGIQGQLDFKNEPADLKSVPYKIWFMNSTSSWASVGPDEEYIIEEGTTTNEGRLSTNIKVNADDLKANYSVYIIYYPTGSYMFCDNPPLHAIYDIPAGNVDTHSLSVFWKKKITVHTQKIQVDTFDKKEMLVYAAFSCSASGSDWVVLNNNENSGDYMVDAYPNMINTILMRKTKYGATNQYVDITDSFYVDTNTQNFTINY